MANPESEVEDRHDFPPGWPKGVALPSLAQAREVVRQGQEELDRELDELDRKLPRWSPDLERVIITPLSFDSFVRRIRHIAGGTNHGRV